MSDLTVRIEALEAQGYELPELTDFMEPTGPCDAFVVFRELLTALEQAQARVDEERKDADLYAARRDMHFVIGRARLGIAERQVEKWVDIAYHDCERAEQAEAEVFEVLKRVDVVERRAEQAEAALAAERAKRTYSYSYPHMCCIEHAEIGHNDSEHERCPLCRAIDERDALRYELEAERESVKALGRSFDKLRDELKDERAERCATCGKHGRCTTRVMEWDMAEEGWFFRYPPSNFSCSKWQPREEAGS